MAEKTVEKELDALRADFDRLRHDIAGIAKAIGRNGAKAVDDLTDTAVERGRDGVAAIERQISERPMATVMVAFSAGMLLGKFLDRR